MRLRGGVLRFFGGCWFPKVRGQRGQIARIGDSCGFAAVRGAGTKRGQSGDSAGTISVCEKITHSHTYRPPFLPTLPHVLADLVALLMPLAAPLPSAVCLDMPTACPVAPAFARIEPHRTPPEMAAKRVPPWPHLCRAYAAVIPAKMKPCHLLFTPSLGKSSTVISGGTCCLKS